LAEKAERFIAALAEFAFATEEVGLDGNVVAGTPIFHVAADHQDAACDFTTEYAGELDGNGQAGRLGPEIDVVKAAALDLNNRFVRAWNQVRNFAQFEFSWIAMRDELQCFHANPKSKGPIICVDGGSTITELTILSLQRFWAFQTGRMILFQLTKESLGRQCFFEDAIIS
jgi:hypothetical protein